MQVVVVGAGPTGVVSAMLLARAGHQVAVLDRDRGPAGSVWERRGVFQFHLPHGFRTLTVRHLQQRLPDVWAALLAVGGRPVSAPGRPDVVVGLHIRREVFEETLWRALAGEPGVTLRCGHVDRLLVAGSEVTGVVLDGVEVPADLVVDASGRNRVSESLRGTPEGGGCGFSYVARQYRLREGAEPGPQNMPAGHVVTRRGYLQLVFAHDNGYFNVLVVRATADRQLAQLRHEEAWEAAMRLLPGSRVWTEPGRSTPAGPVRAGGGLTNSYLGQAVGSRGLLAVGDAVATTNPSGGRGVSLGIASAVAMVDIVQRQEPADWAAELDAWCEENLHPWVTDQIAIDAAQLRRWSGAPVDPGQPLPVDLVWAALSSVPELAPALMPYNTLAATSRSLDHLRGRASEILASGWRAPKDPTAPSHADLVAAIAAAADRLEPAR